jgi:hypothetical protein
LCGFVSFLKLWWKVFQFWGCIVFIHQAASVLVLAQFQWGGHASLIGWPKVVAPPTLGYGLMKESVGLLSSIESAGSFSKRWCPAEAVAALYLW